jgi:hypothetical protein
MSAGDFADDGYTIPLAATDVDTGDTLTYKDTGAGAVTAAFNDAARKSVADKSFSDFGEFGVDFTTGEWTFQATMDEQKGNIDRLLAGETLTLTYPAVEVSDGHGGAITKDVTVTITGEATLRMIMAVTSYTPANAKMETDFLAGLAVDSVSKKGWGAVDYDPDGHVVYTLTQAGRDALSASGGVVFDYITFKDAEGIDRVIQVVLTNDLNVNTLDEGQQDKYVDPNLEQPIKVHDEVVVVEMTSSYQTNGLSYSTVRTFDGDDTITVNVTGSRGRGLCYSSIDGGAGDDTITVNASSTAYGYEATGLSYSSSIDGGAGDDTITVNANGSTAWGLDSSSIDGGAGDDTITVNATTTTTNTSAYGIRTNSTIDGGAGDDTITVNATTTNISAYGISTNSTIDGGAGDDTIIVTAKATDATKAIAVDGYSGIYGGEGDDYIQLFGHVGNGAVLSGGHEADGSGGYDVLHLNAGNYQDVITDSKNSGKVSGFEGLMLDMDDSELDALLTTTNLNALKHINSKATEDVDKGDVQDLYLNITDADGQSTSAKFDPSKFTGETIEYRGVTYQKYTYSENDVDHTLYIHLINNGDV